MGDAPNTVCNDWKVGARNIADELDAIDRKVSAHSSLTDMADRVASLMRERNICGPRGPLSGKTVLRDALQGGRWKREQD